MKVGLCLALAALLGTPASAASEWHTETVDPTDEVGEFSSLAMDNCNRPHISYSTGCSWLSLPDFTREDEGGFSPTYSSVLNYARWNGAEWLLTTVDATGDVGRYNSIALDSSYHPHISYYDATNADLKYARWDGDEWLLETVDSVGSTGSWTSLALDDTDRPHISYSGNGYVKYAYWNGSSWVIDPVVFGACTSLALDSSDRPHIAYYDAYADDLGYASWDGDDWIIETLDSVGDVGYGVSLALDSFDYPHISYIDKGNEIVKHARWDGAAWQIEDVYTETGWMYMISRSTTSLVVDSSDYSRICFGRTNDDDPFFYYSLYYACWNGSNWGVNYVPGVSCSKMSSLSLDNYDNPHVSYMYWNAYYGEIWLDYAWYGDPAGVEDMSLAVEPRDKCVLVSWTVTGDIPAGLRVLRSAGESEPLEVSGALPGETTRWLDKEVEAGGEYRYWLEVVEEDGTVSRFGPTEAVAFPGAARELALSVYPSPASGAFTVDYTLPENGRISISLYDLSGRRITTVYDGETAAGRHELAYDSSMLSPGVYLVRLSTDSGTLTRRVVVAR